MRRRYTSHDVPVGIRVSHPDWGCGTVTRRVNGDQREWAYVRFDRDGAPVERWLLDRLEVQRCEARTESPATWGEAKFHDGRCKRKAVERFHWGDARRDEFFCKQHAEIMRRIKATTAEALKRLGGQER